MEATRVHLDELLKQLKLTSEVTGAELDEIANDLFSSPESDVDGDSMSSGGSTVSMPTSSGERRSRRDVLLSLKAEVQEKERLLTTTRREYEYRISDLEEKIAEMTHQNEILKMKLQSENEAFSRKVEVIEQRTKEEVDSVLQRQRELEKSAPLLRERLEDAKSQMREIEISQGTHSELKKIPPEQRTLKEFVQVNVFELVSEIRREREVLRKENDVLRENLQRTTRHYEKLKREKDNYEFQYDDVVQDQQSRIDVLVERNKKQEKEIEDMRRRLDAVREKESSFEDLQKERNSLYNDLQSSQKLLRVLESSHEKLETRQEKREKELSGKNQLCELLKMDKEYLSREIQSSTSRYKQAEALAARLTNDLEDTKCTKDELYIKLLESKSENKHEYERRLNEEVDKIQRETSANIREIRNNAQEVYERELRAHRDAREIAVMESENLRRELDRLKSRYDELHTDYIKAQNATERELTELRSDVKLKSFELTRLSGAYDESQESLRHHRILNDSLQKKFDVLKEEYHTLQVETSTKLSEMEVLLAAKEDKLSHYEKVENELDEIVLSAAQREEGVSFGNVPTSSRRRLEQSITLARKVGELEKRNTELVRGKNEYASKYDEVVKELESLKEVLQKSQHPQKYLVNALIDRDANIKFLKKEVREGKAEHDRVSADRNKLVAQNAAMRRDLERLLSQNDTISRLRDALSKLSGGKVDASMAMESIALSDDENENTSVVVGQIDYGDLEHNAKSRTKEERAVSFSTPAVWNDESFHTNDDSVATRDVAHAIGGHPSPIMSLNGNKR